MGMKLRLVMNKRLSGNFSCSWNRKMSARCNPSPFNWPWNRKCPQNRAEELCGWFAAQVQLFGDRRFFLFFSCIRCALLVQIMSLSQTKSRFASATALVCTRIYKATPFLCLFSTSILKCVACGSLCCCLRGVLAMKKPRSRPHPSGLMLMTPILLEEFAYSALPTLLLLSVEDLKLVQDMFKKKKKVICTKRSMCFWIEHRHGATLGVWIWASLHETLNKQVRVRKNENLRTEGQDKVLLILLVWTVDLQIILG